MTDSHMMISNVRHRRTLAFIWLTAFALLGTVWWQIASQITSGREQDISNVQRDLANLTRVSQEHANRTFRSADQALRFVQSGYLEKGLGLSLADMAAKGVIDTEIFTQVGVIDERGIYVLSNLPITGRLDLSDREHFRVHVTTDQMGLFVSKPVLGRASGKWSIQLTRRISRPDGSFAGVAVVSIDQRYFARFYSELNLGDRGVHALYGLDGIARARIVGGAEKVLGTTVPAVQPAASASHAAVNIAPTSPMFRMYRSGLHLGAFTHISVMDGTERQYYFRKIPGYELMVVAGVDVKHMLANHERERSAFLVQGVVSGLLVFALAVAIARHLQRMRSEISEKLKARDLLIERTEQLDAIFELSPDGFVSFDPQRRVQYVSPAFMRMTDAHDVQLEGMSEEEFSNWLLCRIQPNTAFASVRALRDDSATAKPEAPVHIEVDGQGHRVLQIGIRRATGAKVAQILYFRDVTREAEVDTLKSEFLSTAAHELRTPMASILGFSEVLTHEHVDAADQREYLQIIHKQSRAMAEILDELLDLARIEARRGKDFRLVAVSLPELVQEAVRTMTPPSDRLLPVLEMRDPAFHVWADRKKLRQALLNVLSNAFKYSPVDTVVQISVSSARLEDGGAMARIAVRDMGIGMTPDQVSRICERFYRADASGSVPGSGLGMSIVKEIVDLHRGYLEVTSAPQAGTTVTICLPLLVNVGDGDV